MPAKKIPPAMPEYGFALASNFLSGFQQKLQEDELKSGSSTSGSKNFILDDDGKWRTKYGTRYFGRKSTYSNTCTSSAVLHRRDGVDIPVVFTGTYSLYLHPDYDDWTALEFDLSDSSTWGTCPTESTTQNMNLLAMGSGNDEYRIWNGATGLVDSATSNTITLQEATTCAARGFTATGDLSIESVYYAYTGLSGNTFTGVTPDPTVNGAVQNAGVAQKPVSYPSAPYGNILLAGLGQRVIITRINASGMTGGGQIYGSHIDDPTDFTFSATRVAGEGFLVNVTQSGGRITGACQFEDGYLVWKGSYICKITIDQNDIVYQRPFLNYDEKLGGDEGCVSAGSVFRLGSDVFFVSPTATVNSVRRVQSVDYPKSLPISDPIKAFMETLTMDTYINGCGWRGRAYFFFPTDGVTLVYDARYGCWCPPTYGYSIISSFVNEGKLYGTLKDSPNILELWTGDMDLATDDEVGIPIYGELFLDRANFGDREKRKIFDRYYIEGEMDDNGTATFEWQFDENGTVLSGSLQGTETGFFFIPSSTEGFGDSSFGEEPFGGEETSPSATGKRKFRIKITFKPRSFHNCQFRVKTGNYFKLISHGPNVMVSKKRDQPSIFKATA
jgi:hypothetical protein